jgi:hypothetical protein
MLKKKGKNNDCTGLGGGDVGYQKGKRKLPGVEGVTRLMVGRWGGFKEVVSKPLLSKVGQGDRQLDAPWGKRVAVKNPQMGISIRCLLHPYAACKKTPIKVC